MENTMKEAKIMVAVGVKKTHDTYPEDARFALGQHIFAPIGESQEKTRVQIRSCDDSGQELVYEVVVVGDSGGITHRVPESACWGVR